MNRNDLEYIECDCNCQDHLLRFFKDSEKDYQYIYVTHFLQRGRFMKRLRLGLKYIAGFKSKFGHFDETLVSKNEAVKLRDYINNFLMECDNNDK